MRIRTVGAELLHAEGRTDGPTNMPSRFPEFHANAPKTWQRYKIKRKTDQSFKKKNLSSDNTPRINYRGLVSVGFINTVKQAEIEDDEMAVVRGTLSVYWKLICG